VGVGGGPAALAPVANGRSSKNEVLDDDVADAGEPVLSSTTATGCSEGFVSRRRVQKEEEEGGDDCVDDGSGGSNSTTGRSKEALAFLRNRRPGCHAPPDTAAAAAVANPANGEGLGLHKIPGSPRFTQAQQRRTGMVSNSGEVDVEVEAAAEEEVEERSAVRAWAEDKARAGDGVGEDEAKSAPEDHQGDRDGDVSVVVVVAVLLEPVALVCFCCLCERWSNRCCCCCWFADTSASIWRVKRADDFRDAATASTGDGGEEDEVVVVVVLLVGWQVGHLRERDEGGWRRGLGGREGDICKWEGM
jgi:hypothetical protein